MPGINTVTMTHFRGATGTTEIDLGGVPLVVIHGGNGTGKSTIADAINLICNRTGGSLKDRSSTTLNTDLPAAGWSGQAGVSVSLTASNETWNWAGAFARQAIGAVIPASPAPPALFVLRRSNLLKLTEAAPAQRYSELGRLIDIPNVEANEAALRAISTQATTILDKARAVYDARKTDLDNLWGAAGNPAPDAETWARTASVIGEYDLALLEDLTVLATSHEAVGVSLHSLRTAEEAEQSALQKVTKCKNALSDYMVQAELMQADLDTLAVLEATAKYLKSAADRYLEAAAEASACPACRQPVGLDTLRADVAARLEGLRDLSRLNQSLKDAQAALDWAKSEAATRRKDVIAEGRALALVAQPSRVEAVTWLGIQWEEYDFLAAAQEGTADENLLIDATDLYNAFCRAYDGATTHLIGLSVIEGLKVDRNILAKRIQLATTIEAALTALQGAREALAAAQIQLDAWSSVCEIVTAQRQRFVTTLLHTVMEDCSTLYSRIHPGEAIHLTNVEMGGAGAGRSLEMTADIAGHEGKPQAYLSDSHLDTLGFCFWLAAVKHYSQGNAVVMLDDVFSSADEEHQKRILSLLQEQTVPENNGPAQIILLTHSNAWRDAVRAEANQSARLIELAPWTYDEGVHA